jgi:hypothetical protein
VIAIINNIPLGRNTVRIQFEGSDGERYTIKLEGNISRDKVSRIIDMYDLLAKRNKDSNLLQDDTMYSRLRRFVADEFTFKKFTSDQLREAFEDRYNQPMKLAAVSTYLSRMSNVGEVSRVKRGRKWIYRFSIPSGVGPEGSDLQRRIQFNKIIER